MVLQKSINGGILLFDKQMLKQLEKMFGKMNPAQKEKLAGIMKDEESIKQALSKIDPQKAKKVAQSLNLDGFNQEELGKMAEKITQNPEMIQELDKNK